MYESEIEALKRANRFRTREIFDETLVDFASNDYLGIAKNRENLQKAFEKVAKSGRFAPTASLLVNGYSQIHKEFEDELRDRNGFESALVVGSGYLANLALVDALVRKRDILFIDEDFHASGVMATKTLPEGRVIFFRHNDPEDLRAKLKKYPARNQIVLVEGVYSMSGNLLSREFFDIARENSAILIVDEAHSSGVVGKNLLGVFDYYNIKIESNLIKMGTLGKAYGSYGAYILASSKITTFLLNRAKPIIYSTALSLLDTALALENFKTISRDSKLLYSKIQTRKSEIKKLFSREIESLILTLEFNRDEDVVKLKEQLIKKGFLVGAIRRPTVKRPILRVIPNIGVNSTTFERFAKSLKELGVD